MTTKALVKGTKSSISYILKSKETYYGSNHVYSIPCRELLPPLHTLVPLPWCLSAPFHTSPEKMQSIAHKTILSNA